MEPINRHPFVENYIQPMIHHPLTQMAFQITIEVIKILAVKFFLEILTKRLSAGISDGATRKLIHGVVVVAPIVEELLFRGVLLRMIHLIQLSCHHILFGREPSEEEKRHQQTFRVHLSAFLFAAVHLNNPHETVKSAIIQFVEAYAAGVSYAYLSEKYKTLSVTILTHGIHNALCVPIQTFGHPYTPVFLTALIIYEIGVYLLAKTPIETPIAARARQLANGCMAIPRNIRHYFNFYRTPQGEHVDVA